MNELQRNAQGPLRPASLRRIEGKGLAPGSALWQEHAGPFESEAGDPDPEAAPLSISSLATAALVGLGLAAVEGVRIGLVHHGLKGFFGDAAGTLPFAVVLTLGLAALDMGLLLRLFAPATAGDNRSVATWAAIGAWLVVTTANSMLAMYALASMMDGAAQAAVAGLQASPDDVAPAAVVIMLLLLRLLLLGALAWDRKEVVRL